MDLNEYTAPVQANKYLPDRGWIYTDPDFDSFRSSVGRNYAKRGAVIFPGEM